MNRSRNRAVSAHPRYRAGVTAAIHLACLCGAPATHVYEVISNTVGLRRDCCERCGAQWHGEYEELAAQRTELLRHGLDERMASRVLAERVGRKELLPTVPFEDG